MAENTQNEPAQQQQQQQKPAPDPAAALAAAIDGKPPEQKDQPSQQQQQDQQQQQQQQKKEEPPAGYMRIDEVQKLVDAGVQKAIDARTQAFDVARQRDEFIRDRMKNFPEFVNQTLPMTNDKNVLESHAAKIEKQFHDWFRGELARVGLRDAYHKATNVGGASREGGNAPGGETPKVPSNATPVQLLASALEPQRV